MTIKTPQLAAQQSYWHRCEMTNRCVKELVGFINVFGKWWPSSGVVGAL
jgi:hypothetical protein